MKSEYQCFYNEVKFGVDPRFTFVSVFTEATEYVRTFRLPFNMISVCIREAPDNPSFTENLETGEIFYFHENYVAFTSCDTPLSFHYTPANVRICVHFHLELFPGFDVFSGHRFRKVVNDPVLAEEAKRIFALRNINRMLTECQAFALRVCAMYWPTENLFESQKTESFKPVLNYVRKRICATLRISDLAELMNCSEGHFTRSFHMAFGMTPKKYLQKELFTRSAALLADPKKNIRAVAAELQFSSEFNFSRFFKRLSGNSPAEYRRFIRK